jgi:hypothetical protein
MIYITMFLTTLKVKQKKLTPDYIWQTNYQILVQLKLWFRRVYFELLEVFTVNNPLYYFQEFHTIQNPRMQVSKHIFPYVFIVYSKYFESFLFCWIFPFYLWRQCLTMQTMVASNSWSTHLSLLSAGITGEHHHGWLKIWILTSKTGDWFQHIHRLSTHSTTDLNPSPQTFT